MNRTLFLALTLCIVLTQWCVADTETEDQVAARSGVIDFAGAFQNDGFKIRDGNWFGNVSKDHSPVVAVNLYNGNDKLKVSVFDESGKPVEYQPFAAGNCAAAGFSPEVSGLYYVKVSLEQGNPATFCLFYSSK